MQHRTRVRRAGTAAAVALLAAACAGTSDESGPPPLPVGAGTSAPASPSSPAPTATLAMSAEEAVTIALDAVGGGEAVETDVDEFEVVIQVWEVTVLAPDGTRHQVSIDMRDGSVVGNETDD